MRGRRLYSWIALCLLWLCAVPGTAAAETAPGGAGSTSDLPFQNIQEESKQYTEVIYCQGKGYIRVTDTKFKLDDPVTRGFAVEGIFCVVVKEEDRKNWSGVYPYQDVLADSPWGWSAYWARLKGIEYGMIQGKGKSKVSLYKPNEKLTRAQMADYFYQASLSDDAMKELPVDMSKATFPGVNPKDTKYNMKAIAWCVQNGIIVTDETGEIRPAATCTWGEYIDMLYNYAVLQETRIAEQTKAA
ncbi:MAG: S-layer homology domain-containing protein [Oscillibacter sp.]|nr:S-layer homology domain-containing protein [Oscillibacter sp.]